MASAKANQVELFAYVRDLLGQLSRNAPPPVTTLLPDAWLATRNLAGAGRGSWAHGFCDTEKLIFDKYSVF